MAIQHYLTMIGAIVSIPFILTPALCMEDENPARGTIICTMIFVTGLVTIFQAVWGCRLPLVQVRNLQINFCKASSGNFLCYVGWNNLILSANFGNLEPRQVEVPSGLGDSCDGCRTEGRVVDDSNERIVRRHHNCVAVPGLYRRNWSSRPICSEDYHTVDHRSLRWLGWFDFVRACRKNCVDQLGNRCWVSI